MNAAGGNRLLVSSYLTLSSGQKVVCPEKPGELGLQYNEMLNGVAAAEIYERYLNRLTNGAQIVHPYINTIKSANTAPSQPGQLGLLADNLSEYEIPLIFMGNQDLPGTVSRPGVLIAMDSSGKIREGFTDARTYRVSSFSPTYFTTDYSFLYDETASFLRDKSGIIILDLGDLARLDKLYDNLPQEVYTKGKKELLAEIDLFVARLTALAMDQDAALLLVTPFPDKSSLKQGNTLTPVLFYQPGGREGLLTSASTKRTGVVTNLDIGPTILNFFGIPPSHDFIGAALTTHPYPNARAFLENMHEKIMVNYLQRPYLLKTYVILQIILVLAMLLLLLFRHPLLARIYPFVLTLSAGPLFFLLLPLLPSNNFVIRVSILLILASLLLWVFSQKKYTKEYLAALYLLTATLIAADLLLGAPLMKLSLLSYDPISGARYYGLGNEYMGVLLGSGLIGLMLTAEILKNRSPRYSAWHLLALITGFAALLLLAALPRWGTNIGGAVSFAGSLIILCLALYKIRINYKTAALICCSSLVLLFLLFYFDMQRPVEAQTHIGLTARLIRDEGIASLLPIISRKVAMNIKLIHYSLWTRVFLTFLAATVFMFLRPPGLMKKIFADYPYLKAGSIAGISGSLIALSVNDSGIVAAATTMIFVVPVLFYLFTERLLDKKE